MKKAYAWIYKIRPHLAQGYSDADAAEYLIEMVPKRLAADARRIKAECQREGTYLNLMHLARELEKVIFDDQSAVAIAPALASVDADTAARFDLLALSEMCGMALSAHGAGSPPESMALVGADGTAKWCSRCPHPNGGRCFADPSFEGPLPVGIHLNAERKKAILKAKAENAKKAGVANARVNSPSQKEVDDYKKRRAARGGRGRGKGRDDDSSPAALAEEVVGAAAAVGADEFYGSLRDITEEDFDVAMCVVAIDDAAAYDSPPLSDAPELFWFVVTESDGEPAVRGAVNRRHLDLEPGAACVSFGTDEDRARAYLGAMRDRQASRTPGALPTLETATPSPAPTPAPVDALIPPPLDPPPACTMILGTVTPAPAPAFSRLARPPPSATPSFAVGGAGLAAAASAAGFGEPLGPAAPPPTGEEAEALIHVIAGTPAPAPDIVLEPRVERRVGTPPPTELAPHAADGTPSTPWTCAPPPIVTAAASVTTAARAATQAKATPLRPFRPPRATTAAFLATGLLAAVVAYAYTNAPQASAAVGIAAAGLQIHVHRNGAERLVDTFARFVDFVDSHATLVLAAIFLALVVNIARGAAVTVARGAVISPVTNGISARPAVLALPTPAYGGPMAFPGLTVPPSPPPSSPPGAKSGGSRAGSGLRPPRADYVTQEQARQLFIELLAGNEQPPSLPASARCLVIGDTGCGRSMGNHREQFAAGSLFSKTSTVLGVGGNMTTRQRGHLRVPVQTCDHDVLAYAERGAILNEKCPFVLLALGRASIEQGVSVCVPPWGGDGYFEYPSGVRVCLLNRNVLVTRPIGYKDSPSLGLPSVTLDSLGIPSDGSYGLYIAAGSRRAGDVTSHLDGRLPLVPFDVKIGGDAHNLLNPAVARALVAAATDTRCVAVLESLDCSTWTAVRFLPDALGRPGQPLRDARHILGYPLAADGSLPRRVQEANTMTEHGAAIGLAAISHGARLIAETPACRGDGCGGLVTAAQPGDALVGAESHVYMFDHPAWVALAAACGARVTVFDQCMFADADPYTSGDPGKEKATALFADSVTAETVNAIFGGQRCCHPKGTHRVLRGTSSSGTYMTSGSEAYPSTLCRALAECLAPGLGSTSRGTEISLVAGVIHGKRLTRANVTNDFIHRSFSHSEHRVNLRLSDALSDVPDWWSSVLRDGPCDACLRGEAPRLGASGSLPKDKGLVFIDIYHTQIPTLWKRERTVVGITHAASRLRRSWRVQAKSQAPDAIELGLAFFNSTGNPVSWIHCDGANELKGSGIVPTARRHQIRITTTLVNSSRQNPQEPSWRALNSSVRKELAQARLPLDFWGWAWDHAEEGHALRPSREPPHDCALGRLLGDKPAGAHRRPFGCLCYPTVAPRLPGGTLVNKMAVQAPRAIHLGYVGGRAGTFEQLGVARCQPGYACYIPSDDSSVGTERAGTIIVTDSVRFIPDCFPGLQRCVGGGWSIPTSRIPFVSQDLDSTVGQAPQSADGDRATDGLLELRSEEQITTSEYDYNSLDLTRGFAPEEPAATPSRGGIPSTDINAGEQPAPPADAPRHERRYLIPADHWPDEVCAEHNGRGWETKVVAKSGKWSKCEFINARDAAGNPFADVWRPTSLLLPLDETTPPPTAPAPASRPDDASTVLRPAAGDDVSGPTPNYDTMPPSPGGDPLREPTRPTRARMQPNRYGYSVSALCADHAEIAVRMARGGSLAVDTSTCHERLTERLSDLAGVAHDETIAVVLGAYEGMPPELQRAVCLMVDYDDIAAELGATSPQATLTRELYAAAMVDAAVNGLQLEPLEPLLIAIAPRARTPGTPPPCVESCRFSDIFDPNHDGCLFSLAPSLIGADISMAAKKKSSPDIFTERQMGGPMWDEPKQVEIGKLERLGAMTPVAADDPVVMGMKVVNTMWAGRCKRKADLTIDKLSARCVLRGDLHSKTYGVDANRSMSPVVRNTSMMSVEAVACLRSQHMRPFDVTGAYLHGEQTESEQVLARPPVGFREFDERGIEILWLMWVPLYGQTDAGAIWNRTVNSFQTGPSMEYERCPNDPCVYSKRINEDGSRITMPLYVDDGRWYYDDTAEAKRVAEADMKAFGEKFEVRFGDIDPKEDYFLGGNRIAPSRDSCSIRCTTYIDSMVKRYADGDVTPSKRFPSYWSYTPADDTLVKEHEAACAARKPASTELTQRYGSLFGSLLHAVKYRPEISAALGLLGSCLTFPTEKLYECAIRVLVYLGRTRTLGTSFTAHGDTRLHAYADSNWQTTRSTSGYVIFLARGAIAHASRRQHCISMSSCEAELVALADLAIELLYIDSLLRFIGYETDGPIEVATDNKAAYDLCHRFTSAQHSRHIDRKLFKMRELRGARRVVVKHVPTEVNPADLFTKVLGRQPFEKHRRTVLNLPVGVGIERSIEPA